jgi:hypothetical protein
MPDSETKVPTPEGAEDWQAPEVPESVTPTAVRQREFAKNDGDPIKAADVKRQEEMEAVFPEVPASMTDSTLNKEKAVPGRDLELDQKMEAGVAEMDAQDQMDRYAKQADADKNKGFFGRLFGK